MPKAIWIFLFLAEMDFVSLYSYIKPPSEMGDPVEP